MTNHARNRVDQTLSRSRAIRLDHCVLNQDLGLARWCNQRDQIDYQKVGHHTLSIYLQGGYGTRRQDRPERLGGPDKICLMPAGQDSRWDVQGPLEFVHVYFAEDAFRHFALTALDLDPRRVELPDLTYVDDAQLLSIFQAGVLSSDWQEPADRLALQYSVYALMSHLLRHYRVARKPEESLRGGLTRPCRQAVVDYMQAHLDEDIALEELAAVASLSVYHFARMFKLSMGVTPHQYLLRIRMQAAQALLRQNVPLAEIGLRCGFANQSHFTRAFRQILGLTPGEYRRAVSQR